MPKVKNLACTLPGGQRPFLPSTTPTLLLFPPFSHRLGSPVLPGMERAHCRACKTSLFFFRSPGGVELDYLRGRQEGQQAGRRVSACACTNSSSGMPGPRGMLWQVPPALQAAHAGAARGHAAPPARRPTREQSQPCKLTHSRPSAALALKLALFRCSTCSPSSPGFQFVGGCAARHARAASASAAARTAQQGLPTCILPCSPKAAETGLLACGGRRALCSREAGDLGGWCGCEGYELITRRKRPIEGKPGADTPQPVRVSSELWQGREDTAGVLHLGGSWASSWGYAIAEPSCEAHSVAPAAPAPEEGEQAAAAGITSHRCQAAPCAETRGSGGAQPRPRAWRGA